LEKELRQEAIKWVKELSNANEFDKEESLKIYGMIKILKHFFNLTKEELK